jgi:hypothetical protein
MRTMVKFTVPITEESNTLIRDGRIEQAMETIVGNLQPEAAYFCPLDGKRGGYLVFNMEEASELVRYQARTFLAGTGSTNRNLPCYERG